MWYVTLLLVSGQSGYYWVAVMESAPLISLIYGPRESECLAGFP